MAHTLQEDNGPITFPQSPANEDTFQYVNDEHEPTIDTTYIYDAKCTTWTSTKGD